jgi:hypothetical protein
MRPFAISLPGVQRLRALHPMIDGDGGCSLVYDAERGSVFEVPEELRFHVAPALDSGDLDEELLGWLTSEDLLTGEGFGDWSWGEPGLAELRGEEVEGWVDCAPGGRAFDDLDLAFRCARGCPRIKLHLDWVGMFPLGNLFEQLVGEARRRAGMAGQEVSFELALDPQEVTPEVARRLAAQPVEVRLRCGEADLAGPPGVHEDRPWLLAEPAVRLLLAHLAPEDGDGDALAAPECGAECGPECGDTGGHAGAASDLAAVRSPRTALTVQCVLDGASRLVELWRWAKALGVRRLDVIRLEDPGSCRRDGSSTKSLREYCQDLLTVQEETACELEAGHLPPEMQALGRVVRHLVRNAGLANLTAPSQDPFARACCRPLTRSGSFDSRQIPDEVWRRLERQAVAGASQPGGAARRTEPEDEPEDQPEDAAQVSAGGSLHRAGGAPPAGFGGIAETSWSAETGESELAGLPCRACWASQVCSHSAFVASPLGNEDPRQRSRETCNIWASEVEAAIRLHHRLAQIDPIQVGRFLDRDEGAEEAPPADAIPAWTLEHLLRSEPS